MPSPTNQCAPGASNCGLGPLRYSVPLSSRGNSPTTLRNGASHSIGIGARLVGTASVIACCCIARSLSGYLYTVKINLYSVKMVTYIAEMARKSQVARARTRRAANKIASSRAVRKRSALRAGASEDAPYHHGALHDALLEAAERVLERDGLSGLTLRAVAREAGVSHAAPTHH